MNLDSPKGGPPTDEKPDIRYGEYPGPVWAPDEDDDDDRSEDDDGGRIYVCEETNDAGGCGSGCNAPREMDDLENPSFPDCEWEITKGDAKGYVYKSDGKGPRTLCCEGQDKMKCDSAEKMDCDVLECKWIDFRLDFFFSLYCYHS